MDAAKILIVEDDPHVRLAVRNAFAGNEDRGRVEPGLHGRVAQRSGRSVFGVLGLAALFLTLFLRFVGNRGSPLAGAWIGRDASGVAVVYEFDPGGRGYRITGAVREDFTYVLMRGYPNELRLVLGTGTDTSSVAGLVEIVSPSEIRLELAAPGDRPPSRLSRRSLDLRRPATR